ncbi:MAG: mobile mystery protein B [Armatimonadota bacterium]
MPLDLDEAKDLIPSHIQTRAELNAWEQTNIAQAVHWLETRRTQETVLTLEFLRELHRRMFNDTWRWAGKLRSTAKNIGVPVPMIQESLRNLLDDVAHWIENSTYPVDEICTRFHHRLVQVHPFPNGNGRHGRLMADALLTERGAVQFTWGSGDLVAQGSARSSYLAALKRADIGDYSSLLQFVRS